MRRTLGIFAVLAVASALAAAPAVAKSTARATQPKGRADCRYAVAYPADLKLAGPLAVAQSCPGVRPGAVVRIPSRQAQCTFNALFLGGDGDQYIGTAGHCINDEGVEKQWPRGKGPVAQDGSGKRIGEFAYAILKDPKDLSLIRLDKGVNANPQMCHFGGPTAMAPNSAGPAVLDQFGQGIAISNIIPGRTQLALSLADPDRLDSIGLATPGDSGSLVTTAAGGAVGVLVTTGFGVGFNSAGSPVLGNVGITRFAPQLVRATEVTGVKYTLQTAPLL
jgi:hypothetical protein